MSIGKITNPKRINPLPSNWKVDRCNIHTSENIWVFYEIGQNEISLKLKVFALKFFHSWLPDFEKLMDAICSTFDLFHAIDES
jgi:hypothetical protein